MSREGNSCPSKAGGLEKRTAALVKMFNGPRISQEGNSCPSEVGSRKVRTAALAKLFNSPWLPLENEIRSRCPERANEAVHRLTEQPGGRADYEGAVGSCSKLTTGWKASNNKSCKDRIQRAGTSWLRGQKLPSVRQKVAKRLKTEEKSERMREEEEN